MPHLRRHHADGPDLTNHWLVKDGIVLASLEVAETRAARTRGLLGRDGFDGAMLFPKTKSVHSFGMHFGLDVAFLDDENTVQRVISLPPNRVSGFHLHSWAVLEAEAGAFEAWGIEPGVQLEITEECE
ncbi:MAG: DUF192 domain-containing protein [Acidimicrobiales bacterium]|nr:DUF192 domain-containing protein [Acidimicrobiales bacterium]